jgi:hypothetical protein
VFVPGRAIIDAEFRKRDAYTQAASQIILETTTKVNKAFLNQYKLMTLLITKFLVTSFIIVLVSEVAKRTDKIGALIASLPFVTIMVMIWLYVEKQGSEKIANHAYYTLWYVVPTLPMFALIPWMLRRGCNFWLTMAAGVALTFASFLLTVWVGKKFGVQLMP